MGYIKEPEGIDFIINGRPLTDEEIRETNEFIKARREMRDKEISDAKKTKGKKGQLA